MRCKQASSWRSGGGRWNPSGALNLELAVCNLVLSALLSPLRPVVEPITMLHAHLGDRCVAAIVITFGGFRGALQGLPLLRKSVA